MIWKNRSVHHNNSINEFEGEVLKWGGHLITPHMRINPNQFFK